MSLINSLLYAYSDFVLIFQSVYVSEKLRVQSVCEITWSDQILTFNLLGFCVR